MQCYDKIGTGYCRANVPLFPFANNFCALPPWPQGLGYFPPPTKITTLRMIAFLLFFSLDTSAILFYKRHSESRSQCQADDHTLCGCFWNSECRKINGPGQMSLSTRQFKSVSKVAHMHTQTQTQTRIHAAWTTVSYLTSVSPWIYFLFRFDSIMLVFNKHHQWFSSMACVSFTLSLDWGWQTITWGPNLVCCLFCMPFFFF